ncbi:hypothetical protein U9M48_018923 [Paspalum notatum var. saurae]|uniref:Uncharacterized protein n=1 Tax=Paspalum notatum var. saurae TaxID=547442 RepID=A0AAQ3WQ81_PASNO
MVESSWRWSLQPTAQRKMSSTTFQHTLQPTAKRHDRVPKSDGHRHRSSAPEVEDDARRVMGEVVVTAVHLLNRMPMKSLVSITP